MHYKKRDQVVGLLNWRDAFWVVLINVCGRLCHGDLEAERSTRVGQRMRIHARPWTYNISVANTTCCRRSADQVVSGCQRWRKLCRRDTPGTFHDEHSASWCTAQFMLDALVYRQPAVVDTGLGSDGHALGAQVWDAQVRFVRVVEGRLLTWADLPRQFVTYCGPLFACSFIHSFVRSFIY